MKVIEKLKQLREENGLYRLTEVYSKAHPDYLYSEEDFEEVILDNFCPSVFNLPEIENCETKNCDCQDCWYSKYEEVK